jgi:ubiquinone/menaquinone biosynthesis C-methylase UbiE
MTSAAVANRIEEDETQELYEHLSRADQSIHTTRDAAFLALLRRNGIDSLDGLNIVEVGCGTGSLIRTLDHYGADTSLVEAVDVSSASTATTHEHHQQVAQADASALPFADASFDLAMAFTSFSAMHEDKARVSAASEAIRVLRPGGIAVLYDFRVNPTNRDARPVREEHLLQWFSGLRTEIERVTLAPPIVRALGGASALCRPLERLPWLRTHLLAAITKETR